MKTQAKQAAWNCRQTEMCKNHPVLFREEGHFGGVESFVKPIFLPLLSQCSLASRLRVLKMFSKVSGEDTEDADSSFRRVSAPFSLS